MNIITNNIKIPRIELQYINKEGNKYFRIKSEKLDLNFKNMIINNQLRIQIWFEREIKKISGEKRKRSWVHSRDFSNKAPSILFSSGQYDYGGGNGWGWKDENNIPAYSTTNGIATTEFEIIEQDIYTNGCITKDIPILDIFTNILKQRRMNRSPINGDSLNDVAIVGNGKKTNQSLRVKLAINYNNKVLFSDPSNELILGIYKDTSIFDMQKINNYIKVGEHI